VGRERGAEEVGQPGSQQLRALGVDVGVVLVRVLVHGLDARSLPIRSRVCGERRECGECGEWVWRVRARKGGNVRG
jgi:hypothetical protein